MLPLRAPGCPLHLLDRPPTELDDLDQLAGDMLLHRDSPAVGRLRYARDMALTWSGRGVVLRGAPLRALDTLELGEAAKVVDAGHARAGRPAAEVGAAATLLAERAPALTELRLDRCRVCDAGAAALAAAGLTALERLTLHGSRVSCEGATALARGLPSLTRLSLASSPVGDPGVAALAAALPRLRSLDLRATGVSDAGLRVLEQLRHLEDLTVRAHAPLRTLPRLARLDLGGSGRASGDAVAAAAPHAASLMRLDLCLCGLGPEGAAQLAALALPNLRALCVQANGLQDAGAVALAAGLSRAAPSLRALVANHNNVADEGVLALAHALPRLELLELDDFPALSVDTEDSLLALARRRPHQELQAHVMTVRLEAARREAVEERAAVRWLLLCARTVGGGGQGLSRRDPGWWVAGLPEHLFRAVMGFFGSSGGA